MPVPSLLGSLWGYSQRCIYDTWVSAQTRPPAALTYESASSPLQNATGDFQLSNACCLVRRKPGTSTAVGEEIIPLLSCLVGRSLPAVERVEGRGDAVVAWRQGMTTDEVFFPLTRL